MERLIVLAALVLPGAYLGWYLWRSAGKGGCDGCAGCPEGDRKARPAKRSRNYV